MTRLSHLAPILLLAGWASCVGHTPPEVAAESRPEGLGSAFDSVGAARGWYLQARVAEARGDLDAADRAMGWMARQGRGLPGTWTELGNYRLRQQRADQAVQAYFQAINLRPEEPAAHLGLARAWLASGHLGDAGRVLEQARELGAWVDEVEIELRLRQGRQADAVAPLARWARRDVVGEERLQRARAALRVGDGQLAVADLLALTQHLVFGAEALTLLPQAAQLGCRHATVAAALEAHPPLVSAGGSQVELGEVDRLLSAGDYDGVLALAGAKEGPSWGWARAGALVGLGRVADAEAVAEQSAGSSSDGARRVARLRRQLGDDEGAVRALVEAELHAEASWSAPDSADFRALATADPINGLAWLGVAYQERDVDAVGRALRWGACDGEALIATAERFPACEAAELLAQAMEAAPSPEALIRAEAAATACREVP